MKRLSLLSLLMCCTSLLFAQKPVLDSLTIVNWPSLEYGAIISNDGCYFMYIIGNQPAGSQTLVVQKTDNSWKKEYIGVSQGLFTADNTQIVIKCADTLLFLQLGSGQSNYVPNISTYKHSKTCKGEWLAYELKNAPGELVLLNLLTGKEQHFTSVLDYSFDDDENAVLLKTVVVQDGNTIETLQWVNLVENKIHTIWSATDANKDNTIVSYKFDTDGSQLVFIAQGKSKIKTDNALWYYKTGMSKAVVIATNQSSGIEIDYSISSSPPSFSLNGKYIFFYLMRSIRKPNADAIMVDIWSYKDSVLQSTQLLEQSQLTTGEEFLTAFNITDGLLIQLEREGEILTEFPATKSDLVVISDKKSIFDYWWKSYPQKASYLVSLKDGSRKVLVTGNSHTFHSFSPEHKYLIYFNHGSYFSYNLLSGEKLNISSSIPTLLSKKEARDSLPGMPEVPFGIAGWLAKDSALLIYDDYDIWQIDPSGKRRPINITNSYGRKNSIKLRSVYDFESTTTPINSALLLTAFNTLNKYNGFYLKSLVKKGDPELLTMGPYHVYVTSSQTNAEMNFKPLKASRSNKWIVMRQSPDDAPNFFFTTDFKNYNRLTNIQPQKKINWLTTELVTWKQFDGTFSQGILYKPENFDPHKKYPIIFFYYEKMSQRMYHYPEPIFGRGDINIPWFVSRGYLVFTPDIRYVLGQTGESVYNSVVSAAQYMSNMPWVDASRMGINGHSFGGYETNYLVTHTALFRAAATAAGPSDLISHYGGLQGKIYGMESGQRFYETSQMRIGVTLWQRPDLYIMNSPIFKADQVTTPLLMMHNKADDLVPWTQSIEFFTGLRRLGKKVWMLQYDEGGHGLGGKEAVDFTIRITQFFDHYLKEMPPPKWMTRGIVAKLKGLESGYELDTSGITP